MAHQSRTPDLQHARPAIALGLDEVGVHDLRHEVTLADGTRMLAHFDAAIELGPHQRGVHMSRFAEALASTSVGAADLGDACLAVAHRLAEDHGASRARVRARAEQGQAGTAPVTGRATFDAFTALGAAQITPTHTHVASGVQAQGMNACPCAQGLVQAHAEERLLAAGYTPDQVREVLQLVPAATHNQRGIGTLVAATAGEPRPTGADMLAVVVGSMSAPIHDLLKRPDELHVVEQAHANPRFVEDAVREMLLAATSLEAASDATAVACAMRNLETIHTHDVVARRTDSVAALRAELEEATPPQVDPAIAALVAWTARITRSWDGAGAA